MGIIVQCTVPKRMRNNHLRFGALGGGGRRGIPPPEPKPDPPPPEPNKLVPVFAFFSRPGIDMLKVWPSLSV